MRVLPVMYALSVSLSTCTGKGAVAMAARDLALAIKAGSITRTEAIKEFRAANSVDFMTALLEIDIAIGDINEGI